MSTPSIFVSERIRDDSTAVSTIEEMLRNLGYRSPLIADKYSVKCYPDKVVDAPSIADTYSATGTPEFKDPTSYTLIERIGSGGFGEVFLAMLDSHLHPGGLTFVAIKFLSPRLALKPEAIKRFEHEVRDTLKVNSDRIVHCRHSGKIVESTVTKVPFYVMELLPGWTLRDLLNRKMRVPLPLALDIGVNLLKGISVLHDAELVHRDLTPENIKLRTAAGGVDPVIMDLGLAFSIEDFDNRLSTGMVIGKWPYCDVDKLNRSFEDYPGIPQNDLFSFGCILYEMIEGKRALPIKARDQLNAHLEWSELAKNFVLPKLTAVRSPALMKRLQGVIDGLMVKEVSGRTLQNANSALTALMDCVELAKSDPAYQNDYPLTYGIKFATELKAPRQLLECLEELRHNLRNMLVELAKVRSGQCNIKDAINDIIWTANACDNEIKRRIQELSSALPIAGGVSDIIHDIRSLRQEAAEFKLGGESPSAIASNSSKCTQLAVNLILRSLRYLNLVQSIIDARVFDCEFDPSNPNAGVGTTLSWVPPPHLIVTPSDTT